MLKCSFAQPRLFSHLPCRFNTQTSLQVSLLFSFSVFFFLFSLCFSLFHPPSHISDLARSTKKIQMLLQYWSSHRMTFGAYHQCEPSRPGRINIFHRWSPQFSSASNSQLVCSIIINTVQCLHTSPHQRSIPSTYK